MEQSEWQWLPRDVRDEILLRLPVKSLLRCKAVCRSWCDLIESKSFIQLHYCHESHEERLVFESGDYVDGVGFEEGNNDRLQLPYFGKKFWYHLGPVNGILCEVSRHGDIVLLNPATHKVKQVPPFPFQVPHQRRLMFGFGYDPSSEDYKIVGFYTRKIDVFRIYKTSSDCWKPIDKVNVDSCLLKVMHEGHWNATNTGECWNGVYYWAVIQGEVKGLHCKRMIGFDMMSEKFRERLVQLPDDVVANFARISGCGDGIAVLATTKRDGFYFCRVVRKEKDIGCWSECLTQTLRINESGLLYPTCVWKNQAVVVKEYIHRKWIVREFYLLHLFTPKSQLLLLPISDKVGFPVVFRPFSYKDSLFAV